LFIRTSSFGKSAFTRAALVSEFDELERKSKADAGGASGDENGMTRKIHKIPFFFVAYAS
jgi:hypothetical protein